MPNGIGDSDHNIGLRFLNHDNIDIKDVKFKPVEQSAVILAMESGEIQGAILSDQFAEKFVEEGKIKYIRSLTYDEDFQTEACCVHALNGDFVRENPITAKRLLEPLKEQPDGWKKTRRKLPNYCLKITGHREILIWYTG